MGAISYIKYTYIQAKHIQSMMGGWLVNHKESPGIQSSQHARTDRIMNQKGKKCIMEMQTAANLLTARTRIDRHIASASFSHPYVQNERLQRYVFSFALNSSTVSFQVADYSIGRTLDRRRLSPLRRSLVGPVSYCDRGGSTGAGGRWTWSYGGTANLHDICICSLTGYVC